MDRSLLRLPVWSQRVDESGGAVGGMPTPERTRAPDQSILLPRPHLTVTIDHRKSARVARARLVPARLPFPWYCCSASLTAMAASAV
jgi:hypothetical protein